MRAVTIQIPEPMKDVERKVVLETLTHFQGNRTHAARALGVSIRTMRNKLHEYRRAGFVVLRPRPPESLSG